MEEETGRQWRYFCFLFFFFGAGLLKDCWVARFDCWGDGVVGFFFFFFLLLWFVVVADSGSNSGRETGGLC